MRRTSKRLLILTAAAALIAGALACGPVTTPAPTTPPEPPPVQTTVPDAQPTEPAPEPTAAVEPTATPTAPAQSAGWLLFSTWQDYQHIDGLWMARPDGSEVRPIISGQQFVVPWDWDLHTAVSPDGRHVAMITASGADMLRELTLHVIGLPGGEIVTSIPLTSAQTEPSSAQVYDDPNFQVVRALSEVNSLAWSPDGQALAFMGAMQGPSSDLYVYSLADGSIRRLTDGESQGIRPIWSPDGRWIVHAGVSSLGTGAGFGMEGVWTAAADGSEVRTLYTPESGDETWLGWAGPDELVLHSWNAGGGPQRLRVVNIASGDVTMLYERSFTRAAFDPASGRAVLAIDVYTAETPAGGTAGAVLVTIDPVSVTQVYEGSMNDVRWDARAGLFLLSADGVNYILSDSNAVIELAGPAGARAAVAPGQQHAVWGVSGFYGETTGLWLGTLQGAERELTGEAINQMIWSDDGQHLFAMSGETLYAASAPDFAARVLADGLLISGWAPTWIEGR
jgi:hypothetical protein